jgi:hypothetical protein
MCTVARNLVPQRRPFADDGQCRRLARPGDSIDANDLFARKKHLSGVTFFKLILLFVFVCS